MSFGIGPEGVSGRDTTGISNSWGTRGGSLIRAILNFVVPVTVIERWYDDDTGSLFALSGTSGAAFEQRPSVEFFSDECDWEMHACNIFYPIRATATVGDPTEYQIICHIFTAFAPYDPIEFNLAGPFGPQLITTELFNQGTVRGEGGTSPSNAPFGTGWIVGNNQHRVGVFGGTAARPPISDSAGRSYVSGGGTERPIAWDKKMCNQITFPRPLRIRRNRRITFQLIGLTSAFRGTPVTFITVSILYTELPNIRRSFRT